MSEAELLKTISTLKTIVLKPIYFNNVCVELLDIIRARHSNGHKIKAHHHPWFEFNYVAKGTFVTFIGGRQIDLSKGKSLIIPPGITHSHIADQNIDDGICIRWQITPIDSKRNDPQSEDFIKCMQFSETQKFDSDMTLLANAGNDVFLNQSVFLHWLMTIYDQRRTKQFLRDNKNRISNQAIIYMLEYYDRDISVTDIANALNMSYRNVSRVFKEETGVTIIEKLNEIRINKARSLLIETDLPISKISEKVGFENIYYFSNMFKKYTNISPAKFRKSNS